MIHPQFIQKLIIGSLALTLSSLLVAQPNLKPSIGLSSLPADSDSICSYPIPVNPDITFNSTPFFSMDTIADFTLYDLAGTPMNMATRLSNGKPIVIVALNVTCPYVRNKVAVYNDIFANYSSLVDIIGVYQLEAHPDDDYSPNSGNFGNVPANVNAGIIVDQHKTYLDRKTAAQLLITNTGLNIPVYMDGPCNEWWTNFGPGPSPGYIIKPNGTVFVKHGWFDKFANGHDIYCDLDSLIGLSCTGTPVNGSYTMSMTTSDTVYGLPGETIDAIGQLTNSSGSAALIEIERVQNNLDIGWTSAICLDVCLSTQTNTYTFLLPDGASQQFWMHFYSDPILDGQSHIQLKFTNLNDTTNTYTKDFYAFSEAKVGVNELQDEAASTLKAFPNPFSNSISISSQKQDIITAIKVFSLSGQLLREEDNLYNSKEILQRNDLPTGVYFAEIFGEVGVLGRLKVVVR